MQVILWTRWGILAFVAFGLSVGLGFGLQAILASDAVPGAGIENICLGFGFFLGAMALWAFAKFALPRLDKPRPQFIHQQLQQPVVVAHGFTVTHRAISVVNQETGQQVFTQPSSNLFFVPLRFWPYVIATVGVINIVGGLMRG